MKRNINLDYNVEILELANKWLPLIDYKRHLEYKPKTHSDPAWWTSEEYFKSIKSDLEISEENSFYNFSASNLANKIYPIVGQLYPDYNVVISGHFYYPPGGFMSWHTNSDKPQKHVYIVIADGDAGFKYVENGAVVDDKDDIGITIREFDVTDTQPLFWHCVYSNCNRYSFGFRLFPK